MRFLTLIITLLILSACGQKGPLFLPDKEAPEREVPEASSANTGQMPAVSDIQDDQLISARRTQDK